MFKCKKQCSVLFASQTLADASIFHGCKEKYLIKNIKNFLKKCVKIIDKGICVLVKYVGNR